MKELAKHYEPSEIESKLYSDWMENKYFHAEIDAEKQPFTIVIPPPNITGQLHMGHAIDNALQDTIIRWKRMQGYSALWLPGTDHASIATEAKIVEAMAKEGITKEQIGREKFLERAWEWKEEYGGRIVQQLKKLGSSCDWERERFTMDEGLSNAVQEVFLRLYNKGLIYRGERIINWCPTCKTSISEAEVDFSEHDGNFWHIKYPVKDSDEFVIVATTRPETMLGDTAVAVNPEDERYSHLVGKTLILPLVNKEIPVIADSYVEKEFGTGCVKITPAHDPNDFEVGERHSLEVICVMNNDATMNENAAKYQGMDRYEARKAVIADLDALGFLVKTQPHKHNVGSCYRCNSVIEPMVSKQWFVKMKPLAEPALEAVKSGEVKFVPERFSKTYYNWMENIHDWCISRQLWWGHRIPAYYCDVCGELHVSKTKPEKCSECGSSKLTQDEDTLDTWFSSALWPFSTLGWPEKTPDLNYFYPTDVLVTGYDIIFFWVARMIFSGIEQMKVPPFKHVFIHGLVRDELGRKMSKSLGNGIDPLEIIEKYGADALRFALLTNNSPGNDMRFYDHRVETASTFNNKMWNASKFILMNFEDGLDFSKVDFNKLAISDKWILHTLNELVKDVTANLDKFELGIALQKVHDFIWDIFCDWYIEIVKPRLYDKDCSDRLEAQFCLNYVFCNALKLLHPFMPFVTSEIYGNLINDGQALMISKWPEYRDDLVFNDEYKYINEFMATIKSIRNLRAEMNVANSRKSKLIFVVENANNEFVPVIKSSASMFEKLAFASEVIVQNDKSGIDADAQAIIMPKFEVYLPLADLVDFEKEIERLTKEKATLENELKRVNGKLNNAGFVSKAPASVIEEEKAKQIKYQETYEKVLERLESLKKS